MRTGRLLLRRPVAADVATILAVHRDPLACLHNPGDRLLTGPAAADRLRHWSAHWDRHGFGYWSVLADPEAAPVGFCGLKLMPLLGEPALNLFYRFAPSVWHRGYASEAAAAVVAWAAANRPDLPLVARIRPDNVASQRVAARAGLHRAPHLDHPGEDGPDLLYTATPSGA
ncbi:GNAT family N-acetyltransferase [Dactylosporangium aurantiacum]|uniref:GNAT family N-acetyltransferase n=1 Tax=Dactylosporangium aurantiacum TaxID=35754 RepID=A0A9Q9MJY5_9ACTN|nr:GNAT family N-acetyltransferase [Dactylosporangium aurantiacum]